MKLKILAVLIALLIAWPVAAYGLNRDKFGLWNDCEPVDLVVNLFINPLSNEAGSLKDRIRTMIEGRLRAARIYTGYYFEGGAGGDYNGSGSILEVSLANVGEGLGITTALILEVYRPDIDEYGVGVLWRKGFTGQATLWDPMSGDWGWVLQELSELTDRFINEYLRVNADACN